MADVPLEDNVADILGKAQRGLGLNDEDLARRTGLSRTELAQAFAGAGREAALRQLAAALGLGARALLESAQGRWHPAPQEVAGLARFTTPFQKMTVNSYLAWDAEGREAVVFDTGADCRPLLEFARSRRLKLRLILLTHAHADHVADLDRLRQATRAPVFVGHQEGFEAAEPFVPGRVFQVGGLQIETRPTSGHSPGGITYVVRGLPRLVAVTGDAIFAGSVGGGVVSYAEALANNRRHILSLPDDTVLCPGHGPMTTVGEEKRHNPFFPEFQQDQAGPG